MKTSIKKNDSEFKNTTKKKQESDNLHKKTTHEDKIQDGNLKFLAREIDRTSDITELRNLFYKLANISSKKNIQSFYNDILRMNEALSYIESNLNGAEKDKVLDRLINGFLSKHRYIIDRFDGNVVNSDYIKSKVLDVSKNSGSAKGVSADVISAWITDENITMSNYQNFSGELTTWLIGRIREQNNKGVFGEKKKVEELSFSKDIHIPYMGYDSSFWVQVDSLHQRKRYLKRNRMLELTEKGKRFGAEKKGISKLFGLKGDKEEAESFEGKPERRKNLFAGLKDKLSKEDRVILDTNKYFEERYLKLDNEEKDLIERYKKTLSEKADKKISQEVRFYISENLRQDYKLDIIKEWAGKKMDSSFEMKNDFVKNILNLVASKAKDIVSLAAGENGFNKRDYYIDKLIFFEDEKEEEQDKKDNEKMDIDIKKIAAKFKNKNSKDENKENKNS